jgi:hypothetical protein
MKQRKNRDEREGFSVFSIIGLFITVGILSVSSAHAERVVLDFEELTTPGTGFSLIGNSYSKDGFTVRAFPAGDLGYWRSNDSSFPGSTALFPYASGGAPSTQIIRDDGLTFDLKSIMISEWNVEWSSGVTLTLNGIRSDNSQINVPIALDGTFGFETFNFEDFTGLKEIRLIHGDYKSQYDNIVLDVIPEPCTLVLMSFGTIILLKRR